MTIYFQSKYGTYEYASNLGRGNCLANMQETPGVRSRTSSPANVPGKSSAGSIADSRHLTLTGRIRAADTATFLAAWDEFKAAHAPGVAREFEYRDDRYLLCEVESITFDDWKGLPHIGYTAVLVAHHPTDWISRTTSTYALTAGGTATATTIGSAETDPIVTLVVSGAPANSFITVSNAADTSFAFYPPAVDTYVFDTFAETVVNGAGGDMSMHMTGDFFQLVAGANVITTTLDGGATLTSASVSWQDRWL